MRVLRRREVTEGGPVVERRRVTGGVLRQPEERGQLGIGENTEEVDDTGRGITHVGSLRAKTPAREPPVTSPEPPCAARPWTREEPVTSPEPRRVGVAIGPRGAPVN
nr:hypothetical protein GCM10020093_059830 [Planobispora longispora]